MNARPTFFWNHSPASRLFEAASIEEEITLLTTADRTFEHYSALYDQLAGAGL